MKEREKENKISVVTPSDNCVCKNCIFATMNFKDFHCAKYSLKPSAVLYENAPCERKKELK